MQSVDNWRALGRARLAAQEAIGIPESSPPRRSRMPKVASSLLPSSTRRRASRRRRCGRRPNSSTRSSDLMRQRLLPPPSVQPISTRRRDRSLPGCCTRSGSARSRRRKNSSRSRKAVRPGLRNGLRPMSPRLRRSGTWPGLVTVTRDRRLPNSRFAPFAGGDREPAEKPAIRAGLRSQIRLGGLWGGRCGARDRTPWHPDGGRHECPITYSTSSTRSKPAPVARGTLFGERDGRLQFLDCRRGGTGGGGLRQSATRLTS